MSETRPRRRAADPVRPTLAALSLPATLLAEADYAELKALIERYEQLLCDWEALPHRTLRALARCSRPTMGWPDAVRRP